MRRVSIIVSICCPHFRDKTDFFLKLGTELVRRGHEVRLTIAGKQACSHIIRLNRDRSRCLCAYDTFVSRLADEYPHLQPGTVDAECDLESTIHRMWLSLAKERPEQREFDGYRLHEICRASIARRFMVPVDALRNVPGDELREVEDAFHKDTIRHLIHYRHLFATWRPDAVVYFGGFYHQDYTAFLAAMEAGVRPVAIEGSFVPGMIWWDESGITGNRGTPAGGASSHLQEALCPTAATEARIHQLFMSSMDCPADRLATQQSERIRLRARLNVPIGQKVVLFLGQVPYDASLVTGGGDFQNQARAVSQLALALRNKGTSILAVRRHPKDDSTRWESRRVHDVPVVVLNEVPTGGSEDLFCSIAAADLVVTVNSQSGLQAAWCGLPVLVLGKAFYSDKGFTIDVFGHERFLEPSLSLAIQTPRKGTLAGGPLISYMAAVESQCLLPIGQIDSAINKLSKLVEREPSVRR